MLAGTQLENQTCPGSAYATVACWQTGQCCIAIVQSGNYQLKHKPSRYFFADTPSDLAKASEMIVTADIHIVVS